MAKEEKAKTEEKAEPAKVQDVIQTRELTEREKENREKGEQTQTKYLVFDLYGEMSEQNPTVDDNNEVKVKMSVQTFHWILSLGTILADKYSRGLPLSVQLDIATSERAKLYKSLRITDGVLNPTESQEKELENIGKKIADIKSKINR